jgi:hypothetical protein
MAHTVIIDGELDCAHEGILRGDRVQCEEPWAGTTER